MIFAAGLGTRMKPLTDRVPKALVEVKGKPLLGHVLDRLRQAGATRIIVNTSVHHEQVASWVREHASDVVLSPEPNGPYDTGGGLAAAAHLFKGDGPIILHNVDVLSDAPLAEMVAAHRGLVTLGVQDRETRRKVLFDEAGMFGWGDHRSREPRGPVRAWAFAGIHVIDPAIFARIRRTGTFPIGEVYLSLSAAGEIIHTFVLTPYRWMDVGTPERLRQAEALPA